MPGAGFIGVPGMTGSSGWMVHVQSLLWLALLTAAAGSVGQFTEILLVDFVHGNPHRARGNALEMMALFTPIMGLLAQASALMTYTVPQLFQAAVSRVFAAHCGTPGYVTILLALPATAFITCYSLFYFIVPLFDTLSPDGGSFPHALTAENYRMALAVQAPATIFAAAYEGAASGRLHWKTVVGLAAGLAVVAGVAAGSHAASGQFQFL
nr:hypothetical protein [uncultured Rhodopila sp.]